MSKRLVSFLVFTFFAFAVSVSTAQQPALVEPIEAETGTTADYDGPYFENRNDLPKRHSLTKKNALKIALKHGVDSSSIFYVDLVPYDDNEDGIFDLVWGVVEKFDSEFQVTYIDPNTGKILTQEPPHEGLYYRLTELQGKTNGFQKLGVGSYESFPWGWNLPFCGAMYVTCGYGCGYHTGSIRNSTDWNLNGSKDCGNPLAAPASGWVTGAGWYNSGYGNVVVVKGANAGNGKNYIWRVAHLNSVSVTPGWWVNQGSSVGTIGTTGNSTGCHIHFEVWRGTVSGASISGETLPISNWPSSGDSVDGYNGSTYNCFTSGNNCSSGDTCP